MKRRIVAGGVVLVCIAPAVIWRDDSANAAQRGGAGTTPAARPPEPPSVW
jgi:hypothetical protein